MTARTIETDLQQHSANKPLPGDLVRNIAFLIMLWIAYAIVRNITSGDLAAATDNARAIIDIQHTLGLPSEAALQATLLRQEWILRGANIYYLGAHFPVTVSFLAWVWRKHRSRFARVRNALIVTTSAGLVIHVVYPLKPPRMMNGFVDTAALLGPDPYELGISGGANQLAAMPSLHVGWALLIAIGAMWIGTSKVKWLAIAHPVLTLAVVVLTANHYWADAVAAAAIVIAAWRFIPTRSVDVSRPAKRPPSKLPVRDEELRAP